MCPVSSSPFRVGDHNIACDGAKKGIPMNHLVRLKRTSSAVFITLLLLCFALCRQVQSATDTPDPGGPLPVSNTADGHNAFLSLTTGIYNSAFGFDSLLSLTDGNFCTAVGGATLILNTGSENTAIGAGALLSNATGTNNTANGAFALFNNTEGSHKQPSATARF